MKYYHGSIEPLKIGTTLKTNRDGAGGYVNNSDPLEAIFELYRPEGSIPRGKSVFLADDPDEIDNLGGYNDHVYLVRVESRLEKSDLHWYTQAQLIIDGNYDTPPPAATEFIHNYWSGKASSEACWEYRATSAIIVEEV